MPQKRGVDLIGRGEGLNRDEGELIITKRNAMSSKLPARGLY